MQYNILLLSLLLCCASLKVSAQFNRILIGDNNNGRIISSKLDGSSITELNGGRYQSYYDADHDPVDQKLYLAWYYGIYSMNYDGSDFDTIIDYPAGGYSYGIAVDPINRHLFWVSTPEKKVYRSNLDGSNPVTIATIIGTGYGGDVSLDLKNNHVYYVVSFGTDAGIYRCNLDGSNPITFLTGGVGYPVEIDSKNDFVYFVQGNVTHRMNTDMSNDTVILNDAVSGIYADTANNQLYLTTSNSLFSCDLNGANATTLISSGLAAPFRPVLFFQCEPTTGAATLTACDSLVWIDGITYYADNNSATFILTNSEGCDSTITLNLTIKHSTSATQTLTSCDSLVWIDGNTYYTDNNTATHIIPNTAGCDSIITLNLTIKHSTSATQTLTSCDSLVWIDGNTYYTDNNTATHIIPNTAGCDSIITLNLTVQVVDASLTQNGNVLTANASGAAYKWVDCDNSYLPIQGATDSVFTATVNGSYALIVVQNGCTDTSDCVIVSGLGISGGNTYGAIKVYPNPASKEVSFSAPVNVVVTNIAGQVIQTASNVTSVDISAQPAGIYFFLLNDDKGQLLQRSKIVKE